jgi:putative redox protein
VALPWARRKTIVYRLARRSAKRDNHRMVKITGEYQGDLHCSAKHEPSGNTLVTDAPKDNQGRGEAFSPTDLTAAAIGTCMSTIMAIAARKQGVELKGMKFEVTKEMSATPPRRIVRLAAHFWVPLPHTPALATLLQDAAHTCPVHLSLHPSIEKPVIFHWAGE